MSRRVRIDPETARLVEERLEWLLREHGPQPPDGSRGSSGNARPPSQSRLGTPAGPARDTSTARPGRRAAAAVERGTVREPRSRRGLAAEASRSGAAEDSVNHDRQSDDLEGDDLAAAELFAALAHENEVDGTDPVMAGRSARTVGTTGRQQTSVESASRRSRRDVPTRDLRTRDLSSRDVPTREPRPSAPPGPAAALLHAAATFRRPHLVIVGVIVALGILLAGWAVLRARPVAVAVTPPAVAVSDSGAPGSEPRPAGGSGAAKSASDASPGPSAPSVVVHVLGAVKKPGLVTLTAGSRVQDALDAAGGLTRKADPGELNLAQQLADGQQITVGTKGKPSGELRSGSTGGTGSSTGSEATGGSAAGGGQPVNLNTASQAELEELPGVGPVMAGKIIAWRTEHGRFSRVEELQEIVGVGPKTYAKLAPLCQV